MGSCTVSDLEDGDGLSIRLNRSFSSWNLLKRSSSIYTDSSEDLASLGGDTSTSEEICSSLLKQVLKDAALLPARVR